MNKLKSHKFDEILENELKNPDFKKEYNALEKEFSLAKEFIALRKCENTRL